MILLIDNYDSFVYNLARYVGLLGYERKIVRNDAITLDEIAALSPKAIIISPGPCAPDDAGISLDVIREFSGRIPILGVCLGHQAIGQVFGGKVLRSPKPCHGKTSTIIHNGSGIFKGLPDNFAVARYHSLMIELGEDSPLEITSKTEDGAVIMSIAHKKHPTYGVQFHPESILTDKGLDILKNFMALAKL